MAQRSRFFDSVGGDRTYDSAAFAQVISGLAQTGIVDGEGNEYQVLEASPPSMNVRVNTGKSFILGYFHEVHTAMEVVAIAAAHATLARIDRVVIRRDLTNRQVVLAVVQGTPAASPAAPALTQNTAGIYEIPLAQVRVDAAVASIVAAKITDERLFAPVSLGSVMDTSTGHDHDGVDSKTITYANIASKPSSFTPSAHAHANGSVEGQVPFANLTGAFDATNPSTQAIGDAAAVGAAAVAARRDHKHAMPAFGNVVAQTAFGAASTNGSAATVARSDHAHGTPAAQTASSLNAPTTYNTPATATTRRVYVGTSNPTGMSEGDLWFDG